MTGLRPRLGALLGAVALVALVGATGSAQQPVRRDTLDEAPLTLVYRPYVRTIVTALQHRGKFYLPLRETLAQLEIDHLVDPRWGTATGRFPKRGEYRIDFRNGTAAVRESRYVVSPEEFLIGDLEIFVTPSLLKQLFELEPAIDANMLTVEITSPEELPVVESVRRRERHARFAALPEALEAPMQYARQRRVFDGGVLEYSLVGESTDRSDVLRFHLVGGGELLGGDVQGTLGGSHGAGRRPILDESDWRWRFASGDSRTVSQLTLGRFYSNGLQPTHLTGVAITNRPVELRRRLGTHTMAGVVEPNAEVELYINDRLVGVTRADPFGQYRFAIPLSYGTSIVRVQSYDVSGSVRREQHAFQLPYASVPRGSADYEVEAGRSRQTGAAAAHGRIAVGLSNSITSSVGIDFGGVDSVRRWVPYGSLSARLGSGQIVGLDVAPRVLYRASWEALFPSRANVGATVTRFRAKSRLNEAGVAEEWSIRAYTPLGSRASGAMLQGHAHERRGADGSRTSVARVAAGAQLGLFRPLVGYEWSRLHSANGGSGLERRYARVGTFAHPFRRLGPRWMRPALLSWWQMYDLGARQPRESQFHVSSPFAFGRSLELSFNRDHLTRTRRLDLQLVLDHPDIRSATTMSRQWIGAVGSQRLTQSVRGAVGYDSRSRTLVLGNRPWAGQSAVAVRFFLDRNGSGQFDAAEQLITGATIRLDYPVTLEAAGPGLIRATNLPAYQRITATVDVSGVRNPLWIPKSSAFAFIADPNRFKPIDVPFYVAGVVEGNVVRRIGAESRPVAGLKVRLQDIDADSQIDLATFSDGTFYHMGLPPGRYLVQVDSTQLAILGVLAYPATRTFTVHETPVGDVVEGLDFVLVPLSVPDSSAGPRDTSRPERRELHRP